MGKNFSVKSDSSVFVVFLEKTDDSAYQIHRCIFKSPIKALALENSI